MDDGEEEEFLDELYGNDETESEEEEEDIAGVNLNDNNNEALPGSSKPPEWIMKKL